MHEKKSNPKGCIVEENVVEETIFIKNVITISILLENYNNIRIKNGEDNNAHMDRTKLSAYKMVEVLQNSATRFIYMYSKIQLMLNPILSNYVDRELVVSKQSVSKNLRWISNRPNKNVLKYESYAINGYTFCTKRHEVITYTKFTIMGFYKRYGYLIIMLKILQHSSVTSGASILRARSVGKKCPLCSRHLPKFINIAFRMWIKNSDNILPRVDPEDLLKESQNDYFRPDCRANEKVVVRKSACCKP
uniref:Uncharacterized protein n=1 Tax=Lactuca sativa TaxID=4236 RepID=A0A9R1XEU2_LACSA|nr:hypothetical protein LSAT_V11C500242210 [Lactuca sativa]